MKIDVQIELRKLGGLVRLAEIKGSLKVKVLAEAVTSGFVEHKLLRTLRDNGFKGSLIIDGKAVKI